MADLSQRMIVQQHDSPLGQWRLVVLLPHARLSEAVEFIWCVEGDNASEVARILPRGNAHLMFNLGAPQRLLDVHGVREPVLYRHAWVSGQQQRYLDVAGVGATAIIGVRFQPLGAWRVLGIPQHELAERVLDLDAVLGDAIHALRERLLEQADPDARLSLFEDWLLECASARGEAHYAVRWALRRLQETHGQVEVQELAAELGFSRKHLAQLFQREAGLTPKALARVLRFSRALSLLREASAPQWDQLAQDCGYYDQSHLIREFQALAGHSPGDFLRRAAFDDESISEAHLEGGKP
jgi:AraC-like DNA-binding protein